MRCGCATCQSPIAPVMTACGELPDGAHRHSRAHVDAQALRYASSIRQPSGYAETRPTVCIPVLRLARYQRNAVADRVWKTAPKNVRDLMEKRARCGVLRWISSQGVWRDDLDLTMLKAAIGDSNCPSNQSIDADALI